MSLHTIGWLGFPEAFRGFGEAKKVTRRQAKQIDYKANPPAGLRPVGPLYQGGENVPEVYPLVKGGGRAKRAGGFRALRLTTG